jgi:hypothetical protein
VVAADLISYGSRGSSNELNGGGSSANDETDR